MLIFHWIILYNKMYNTQSNEQALTETSIYFTIYQSLLMAYFKLTTDTFVLLLVICFKDASITFNNFNFLLAW